MKMLFLALCLALICTMVFAAWQAPNPTIDFTEAGIVVQTYTKGQPSLAIAISRESEIITEMARILKAKDGQWKHSIVSFAPVLLIKGKTFKINCLAERIVVNSATASGDWRQVASGLTKEESTKLRALALKIMEGKTNGKK